MFRSQPCITFLITLATLVSGCAQIEESASKLGIKVEKAPVTTFGSGGVQASAGAHAAPAAQAAQAKSPFAGTPLEKIFEKQPVSNSSNPETFPRVAITVKSATESLYKFVPRGAEECITFDVRLWTSETRSSQFADLRMCAPEVSALLGSRGTRTLDLLPRYQTYLKRTTAGQRTEGPIPPFYVFPQPIEYAHGWIGQTNGRFYLAAIFAGLGWDWDNDFDRRLWIVSLPNPKG